MKNMFTSCGLRVVLLRQALGLRIVRVGCWNIILLARLLWKLLKPDERCDTMSAMKILTGVIGSVEGNEVVVDSPVFFAGRVVGAVSGVSDVVDHRAVTVEVDDDLPQVIYGEGVGSAVFLKEDGEDYTQMMDSAEVQEHTSQMLMQTYRVLDGLTAFAESVADSMILYHNGELTADEFVDRTDLGLTYVQTVLLSERGLL